MSVRILVLFSIMFSGSAIRVYPCTCGGLSIEKEMDRAFDIVIAKVTSERIDDITCGYSFNNKAYDFSTSVVYSLAVEFSFKGKMNAATPIPGGKGGGDCGGIFHPENEYLIVVSD